VFKNRVLRTIFGPKKQKVRGSWRKCQNLYSSQNIKSRKMRLAEHIAQMVEMGAACKILVGKRETK
jgi:hypothetical protein